MGAGEFSTIKTANLAMIQATRQLMVLPPALTCALVA
jgi:hypothetical protein